MKESKACMSLGNAESCLRLALLVTLFSIVFVWPSIALARVQALFNLDVRSEAPFPTNWFSVTDTSHNTNIRVNLPLPDCAVRVSDCEDIRVLNTLDGFNLQPRLSIPFDGPIDVNSVTNQTVFLINLGSTLDHGNQDGRSGSTVDLGDQDGRVIGINQVVWDPKTYTLHVKSDEFLDQHGRYALIVTGGVHDVSGDPVEATRAFRLFRQTVRGNYKQALLDAIHAARRVEVREHHIAVASVFTTQSVTAVMEKIRDQIKATTPARADFNLGPGGRRTVFPLMDVTDITFSRQIRESPPGFDDAPINELRLLREPPGVVGTIAYGMYTSPSYEVHPGDFIPPVGTRTGTPVAQSANNIHFTLVLPTGPVPPNGWPVVVFGHGAAGTKNDQPFKIASRFAAHGLGTIAISSVGNGFGALSTLTVRLSTGEAVTLPSGGRSYDQNGDHIILQNEGNEATAPRQIIQDRDGRIQTVADLMQLVRVIEAGVDVEGRGSAALDSSRIYYVGQALGAFHGTLLLAVDSEVRAGALIADVGPRPEAARYSPLNRPTPGRFLASRTPSLRNSPGVVVIDGVAIAMPALAFDENAPLRNGVPFTVGLADGTTRVVRSPVTNTVSGAMEIQQFLENVAWAHQSGEPLAYASHLQKEPLGDVPAKPVLMLIATGDQFSPNFLSSMLLRTGDLTDRTTLFRNDLAFAENHSVPKNPHLFVLNVDIAAASAVALGAQEQIAVFLATDGELIIHPEPARFFEVPVAPPPPEGLNYIP